MSRPVLAVIGLLVLGGLAALFTLRRGDAGPDAGIPLSLAEDRAARISDLTYDAAFTIPLARTEPITGRLTSAFSLADASRPIAVDFAQPTDRLTSVTANGRSLRPRVENGHVVIPARALNTGSNTIAFEFVAGDEALNRRDDFMYTLFVPARASLAMPLFDQPNLKARWRLALDVPDAWAAVANGAEATSKTADGRRQITFAETAPISTYLFAFAAGKFTVDSLASGGRTLRMFHRETDTAKVARNRAAVADLHAKALAWLEDYTGIDYPFGKLDIVLIPSFQFGGMEHPGAILYNAGSILLDPSATQSQLLDRANTISHETSHMWFGDLVTMRWFDDVWMKEVFANFMAAKIVNPSFPGINHELRFFLQTYPGAYGVDRTEGANPIRQPLDNLADAGSLYGAIIYQKAPVMMRQLELLVGAEPFRDGLREYLAKYSLGNASWPDLIAILDARTPADLTAWSHAWVQEAGQPTIRTVLEPGRVSFQETDPRGRGLVWSQRIDVALGGPRGVRRVALTIPDSSGIDLPAGTTPRWILP